MRPEGEEARLKLGLWALKRMELTALTAKSRFGVDD